MTKDDVQIIVKGLEEPGADLIVKGNCKHCGLLLWHRQYREADVMAIPMREFFVQLVRDVAMDGEVVRGHRCTIH